jgi:hypothetical protein
MNVLEMTVYCVVHGDERTLARCREEGCAVPDFMTECLGRDLTRSLEQANPACVCGCDCHTEKCGGPADYDFSMFNRNDFACQPCVMQCGQPHA